MGTVTIYNGTNVPINSLISSVFNYSWVNRLMPGEYYTHEAGSLICTLSTRYWVGENSEFRATSAKDIGLWVAGAVVAIVGAGLAIATMGAATPVLMFSVAGEATLFTSGTLALVAGGVGAVGVGATFISVSASGFTNEAVTWTNIHAAQNRKFIARAAVKFTTDEKGHMNVTDAPPIQLDELINNTVIWDNVKKNATPYKDPDLQAINTEEVNYLSTDQLAAYELLNTPLRIFPFAVREEACWEVENDSKDERNPIQLYGRRTADETLWKIISRTPKEFVIYNESLKRYAAVVDDRLVSVSADNETTRFSIIAENDRFIFKSALTNKVVIPEIGNLGNSTKLLLVEGKSLQHNQWARWSIVKETLV